MISLIVATCNRVTELDRLLASLEAQTFKDFEILIVDQNPDDRLVPVLQRYAKLQLRHLRSAIGLSRSRNLGLRTCTGDIVAFPDDDCWYPETLLADIVQWFEAHGECDSLVTGLRDPEGKVIAPKFPPAEGWCSRTRVTQCAVSMTIFLRRKTARAVGFFREDLGLGSSSPYQSGEDLDYMIRAVDCGSRVWHRPSLTVYHPDFRRLPRLREKTYAYSLGVGYLWRQHKFSWWSLAELLLRSLAGAAARLCQGDVAGSRLYLVRAKGQFQGYMQQPKRAAEAPEPWPVENGIR